MARIGAQRWAGWVVAGVAGVVAYPGAFVLWEIVRGIAGGGGAWPVRLSAGALLNTAAVAGLIAVLATAIAIPAAWAARRLPGRVWLLFMVPMLMPSYLAYIGWGLLKAPGTRLGDWLMRGPGGVGVEGNWWPVVASKVFAVGGLVLWSWPLAALVMGAGFRRIEQGVLDSLRMEAGRGRRVWVITGISRGAILGAVGLVALVMMGSAVPLHVAQFETYAVQVWRALDEVPAGQRWRIWAGAWPLVVVAVGVGCVVGRRIRGGDGAGEEPRAERGGTRGGTQVGAGLAGFVVWGLSVLVPIGLLVANLRGWGAVATFWKISSRSFWWSVGVAGCVGVVSVGVVGCVWIGSSNGARGRSPREDLRRGREARREKAPSAGEDAGTSPSGGGWESGRFLGWAMTALLVVGLMPGVLVGSAMGRAWDVGGLRWVGDSWVIVVMGHVARFGFVAALAGWFAAGSEGRELRDLRAMDAGGSLRGWVEAALPPQVGLLLGTGVGCALLSFHEIEATVMLQPPTSMGGGFAWKVLQALHFSREEDLIPAMLTVMGVGLGLALAVVGLLGLRANGRAGVSQ